MINGAAGSLGLYKPFLEKKALEEHSEDVYKRYQQTSLYIDPANDDERLGLFGKLPIEHSNIPGGVCAGTSGMALLAGHIKEKKNLEFLSVAHSIEAFVSSLKEKCSQNFPFRSAWIVCPAQSWCPLPPNFPLHKVCVAIEADFEEAKKIVKMVILDGMPVGRQAYITQSRFEGPVLEDVWDGYGINDKFNAPELICRAFFKAIDGLKVVSRVFHCSVLRLQEARCEVVALKDAQLFLQNKNFFKQIKVQEVAKFPIKSASLHKISHLPPEFMKSTEPLEILEKYIQEYYSMLAEEEMDVFVKKEVFDKYRVTSLSGQNKNEFTTVKLLKYSSWAIKMMEQQPDKARALINSTLCFTENFRKN